MSHRSVEQFTCDYCEKTTTSELDDPEDWYTIWLGGTEEGNFCSKECIVKDFQPEPDVLLEAF